MVASNLAASRRIVEIFLCSEECGNCGFCELTDLSR